MTTSRYLAHSANAAGHTHALKDHLACVSKLAQAFLKGFPGSEEAGLAGLLHDLGKYGDRFQARLQGKDSGLDHWSQGAWLALKEHYAVAAALAIEGHHVGLQPGGADSLRRLHPQSLVNHHPFLLALSDPDVANLTQRAEADGLRFDKPSEVVLPLTKGWEKAVAAMLDVRLLFSCLVDADFLDTEAHFEGDERGKCYRESGPVLEPRAGPRRTE